MSISQLAMGLVGFLVAFVSVVVLEASGHQNVLSVVLVAAFIAGIAVATIIAAKG